MFRLILPLFFSAVLSLPGTGSGNDLGPNPVAALNGSWVQILSDGSRGEEYHINLSHGGKGRLEIGSQKDLKRLRLSISNSWMSAPIR